MNLHFMLSIGRNMDIFLKICLISTYYNHCVIDTGTYLVICSCLASFSNITYFYTCNLVYNKF
jgi:hypothetical protein